MKSSLKTNIIVDLLMFLAMAVVSISGIVIRVVAPMRRFAHEAWVRDAASTILWYGRRLWVEIHLWAGVILLVLLVVHIVLHWRVIDGFFKKHIESKAWRSVLYGVLFVLLLLSTIPWLWAL